MISVSVLRSCLPLFSFFGFSINWCIVRKITKRVRVTVSFCAHLVLRNVMSFIARKIGVIDVDCVPI